MKREPGGPVSNWLHDNLKVGDWVPPLVRSDRSRSLKHPSAKYLFLSAGVGITPSMSMIRTLHDLAEPTDVVLVHSVRSPAHIVFRSELTTWTHRTPISAWRSSARTPATRAGTAGADD